MQRRIQILTAVVALPALALGIAACSAKTTPPGPSPAGTTATAQGCSTGSAPAMSDTITIKSFVFLQCPDTVAPGATITVHNNDGVTHTVTATSPAGAFDTGDISGGATKTFKAPTKPGSYDYICSIHTYMIGVLVVS